MTAVAKATDVRWSSLLLFISVLENMPRIILQQNQLFHHSIIGVISHVWILCSCS